MKAYRIDVWASDGRLHHFEKGCTASWIDEVALTVRDSKGRTLDCFFLPTKVTWELT